ncbi:MAG: helix-turn-helix transcriptional regulator [Oscillospiraceae bacterium]|jgi:putative transcriptional regulator|nr:helix-turn-helix transcriptional regulator [Oscillospiraceae bacterium]
MIRLRVLELLEKRGKTKYWLYKQMGTSYSAFDRMIKNDTKMIKFSNIEALCNILECEPNELFEINDDAPRD